MITANIPATVSPELAEIADLSLGFNLLNTLTYVAEIADTNNKLNIVVTPIQF